MTKTKAITENPLDVDTVRAYLEALLSEALACVNELTELNDRMQPVDIETSDLRAANLARKVRMRAISIHNGVARVLNEAVA